MKTINKFFFALASLSIMAVSCQKPVAEHEAGEPDLPGCQKVYFPTQDFSAYAYLSPDAPCEFEVTIARELDDEAITVPVVVKANVDGIFHIEEPVTFEAGQKETSFKVTFPDAEVGVRYSASFSVDDPQYASKYTSAATFVQFATMRVEWKWVLNEAGEPAEFTFEQGWWGETHYGKVKYYEIDGVRYCETVTEDVDGFFGVGDGEISFVWYTNLKTSDGYQAVSLDPHNLGDQADYGVDIYWWDWWSWWTISNPQSVFEGKDFAFFVTNYSGNYPVSWYDNGAFYFHSAYYYMDGVGGWKQDAVETYLIADGFTRIDYSLDMEAALSSDGQTAVYFEAGADVASVKVAAAEGKLNDKAVEALAKQIDNGEVESYELDMEELAMAFQFEESGFYTYVAVAYNSDAEIVNTASCTEFYVAAGDHDYDLKLSCNIEAVPARYDLPDYSTAAIWIAGEDITDVKYAVIEASKLSQSTVYSLMDSESVSAEVLEEINGRGGYYTIVENLKANTEYALLVYATNGAQENFWVKTYTTDKRPYSWILLGEGTLTEPFTTMFGEDALVLSVDVYKDENTPVYMYKGAGLQLANWFYEQDMTPYEGQYWDDEGIIFDATNPDKVVIDNQYYGFNAGSSYGWPVLTTIANGQTVGYGKLANGHLTLTAREYLVGMGTSFYYGPAGYDLALPTAATKAVPTKVNYVEKHEQSGRTIVSAPAFAKEKVAIERDLHVAGAKAVKVAPKAKANRNSEPKAVKLNSIR